jgi:adenosylcobinamide-phosphate synthase
MSPADSLLLASALLLAWLIDLVFSEPRSELHPVAWLGRLLGPLGRGLRTLKPAAAFVGGAFAWSLFAVVIAFAAAWLQDGLLGVSAWWGLPLLALLVKPTFAWRMLRDEVAAVDTALGQGIESARDRLSRLVSRDVSAFDEALVRESAIETLAENLNDSLVAPLFWFVLAGLPGAAVYRFANTADAMWGYRGEWEWAGKWSARADDVLSWLPARITGITAVLLLPVLSLRVWRELIRQAARTPSPNGGWPMAAMALRLGVRLSKPGVYALNEAAPAPGTMALRRALSCSSEAAWAAVLLAILFLLMKVS